MWYHFHVRRLLRPIEIIPENQILKLSTKHGGRHHENGPIKLRISIVLLWTSIIRHIYVSPRCFFFNLRNWLLLSIYRIKELRTQISRAASSDLLKPITQGIDLLSCTNLYVDISINGVTENHVCFMEIHNRIMRNHCLSMVIYHVIRTIESHYWFMKMHNPIMDVHNSFMDTHKQ